MQGVNTLARRKLDENGKLLDSKMNVAKGRVAFGLEFEIKLSVERTTELIKK